MLIKVLYILLFILIIEVKTKDVFVDVVAVETVIVINNAGTHDPNGLMFALAKNKGALEQIKNQYTQAISLQNPSLFDFKVNPLVQPLVLRCNKGDIMHITFTNYINGKSVGMHLHADFYDADNDGSWVGNNKRSNAATGETILYTWTCLREGAYDFSDVNNIRGDEQGTQIHGLFGALVVEPTGAVWSDPTDINHIKPQPQDGTAVDVHPLGNVVFNLQDSQKTPWLNPPSKYAAPSSSFREFVLFFHDEQPRLHHPFIPKIENPCNAFAPPCVRIIEPDLVSISYRSEPMEDRIQVLLRKLQNDPNFQFSNIVGRGVYGEEIHHTSWLFGDPVTPVFKTYVSDPVRIHVLNIGLKETHIFHLHHYQWHTEFRNRQSPVIDAISVAPATVHSFDILYGAGTRVGAIGDSIFHCHLYPHFEAGMWGILRTFDTYHTGQDFYPDGTLIQPLAALPDRIPPPAPTPTHPGFPNFIPGTFGQKPPNPPYHKAGPVPPEFDLRSPTPLELAAFNKNPQPGYLYPKFDQGTGVEPVLKASLSAVAAPHIYNSEGWTSHEQVFYILDLDLDKVTPLTPKTYEPFVLHAPANTILELTYTNRLPTSNPTDAFSLQVPLCPRPIRGFNHFSGEVGLHVHLVKFDFITSDGAAVGWNYMSGVALGQKGVVRWWIDEEFSGIFFHDHLFALDRQRKGLYGLVSVHPPNSIVRNPFTFAVEPFPSAGLQKVIENPDLSRYRDFSISIADFQPAWNAAGSPLNPPACPGGLEDPGVVTINYRSVPLVERALKNGDPKDWFNSLVWGDPYTVIFETYPGEPIRIRFHQGAHEEPHSFQINGMRWNKWYTDPESFITNEQGIGISEVFRLDIDTSYGPGDYLYKDIAIDYLWLGTWGLIRSHDQLTNLVPIGGARPIADPCAGGATRKYSVVARSTPLEYFNSPTLSHSDPFGRIYEVTGYQTPGQKKFTVAQAPPGLEVPLVLRAKPGEILEITLTNQLTVVTSPEPFFPQTPLDIVRPNEVLNTPNVPGIFHFIGVRPVSQYVSLHIDLLSYDVRKFDGYNVGRNGVEQGVAPGLSKVFKFCIDPKLSSPAVIHDGADIRYNKHHGLIGAVIIEPTLAEPTIWYGPTATVHFSAPVPVFNTKLHQFQLVNSIPEIVIFIQDGLRHYINSNTNQPVIDFIGTERPTADIQSLGQKGYNYRSHPIDFTFNQVFPYTPIFSVISGGALNVNLVSMTEKSRPQGFTIHGHSWITNGHENNEIMSATFPNFVHTSSVLRICPVLPGFWIYRSTNFASAIQQGQWGWVVGTNQQTIPI